MDALFAMLNAPHSDLSWRAIALSLICSFTLSMVVAAVYVYTHQGLSYSRSYVQSLVLGSIVSALLMLAIGNNVARGIGIVGTLAIIRFRSTMKDPRDLVFIFAALGVGIASGVRAYGASVAGTALFAVAALLMRYTLFGARQSFDGLVRLQMPPDPDDEEKLRIVLERHCKTWILLSLREVAQGAAVERAYHVKLVRPSDKVAFVADLETIPHIRAVSLYLQQIQVEM